MSNLTTDKQLFELVKPHLEKCTIRATTMEDTDKVKKPINLLQTDFYQELRFMVIDYTETKKTSLRLVYTPKQVDPQVKPMPTVFDFDMSHWLTQEAVKILKSKMDQNTLKDYEVSVETNKSIFDNQFMTEKVKEIFESIISKNFKAQSIWDAL